MRTGLHRRRLVLLAAGVVVLAAVVVVAVTRAKPYTHSGDHYVALGSSFAAGPGLAPITDEGCGRSGANYPARAAEELNVRLTDVTCKGASVEVGLMQGQDVGPGQRPPQLDALGPDTRLVTITIGGNDVGYAAALDVLACGDTGGCPGSQVDRAGLEGALDSMQGSLAAGFAEVRAKAPNALVLAVTYLQVVPSNGETCDALGMGADNARYAGAIGARIHNATVAAARTAGVRVVDAFAASEGHTACSADPWVSGHVATDTTVAFHPTAAGMAATARLVVDTVADGAAP